MKTKFNFRFLALTLAGIFVSFNVWAQSLLVKGSVEDTYGDPVAGANVIVKGTTDGTITDVDGHFTMKVPKGSTLLVSFIGYKAQEVPAAANVKVILQEDSELLDDVVVIGYGVAKKNDLTGSVTAIKPDEKNKGLVTSAQDMMQGKIAGVNVTTSSGAPGAGATIRVRGGSSLNASNDPLIVIDGLAMDNQGVKGLSNPLSMVNPNDIESFTVLKDASATAIYGSRGSNGVIIITTKKGRKNLAPQVSYNGNVSISTVPKTLDVLSAGEYRDFVTSYYGAESEAASMLGTANTDWQDEIYRTAVGTDHNVTVSGGIANMPYRMSVGYTDQNGVLKTSDYQRTTISMNLNPSFLQNHLKFNVNAKYMFAHSRYANTGAIGAAVRYDPTQSVTSDDAKFANYNGYHTWVKDNTDGSMIADVNQPWFKESNATSNPVALLNEKNDRANSYDFMGNVEMDYKVHGLEDLHVHMNFAGDWGNGKQTTDMAAWGPSSSYYGNNGYTKENKYNLIYSAYAQYMKELDTQHFDLMAGYEWSHKKYWGDSYYAGLYPSTYGRFSNASFSQVFDKWYAATDKDMKTPYVSDGDGFVAQQENIDKRNTAYAPSGSPKGWKGESYLVSFYGRLNWIGWERYMLTATVRRDGSSRFKDHWATFPSLAFGWKVNEESFLKDVDVVSDLKLRLGWGKTGQQDGIGDYNYFQSYGIQTAVDGYYPLVGDGTLYRPNAFNENLKWETTTTWNAGLDFGFFNDRLTAAVDAYYRETTDLINYATVAAGTNFRNQVNKNIGSLENKGVEFSVTGRPIQNKTWMWEVSANVTYNHNEITELTGENSIVKTGGISSGTGNTCQAHAVGHPASSFYVYQQVYAEDGSPIEGMYVDRNADGQINTDDLYFYKAPVAPWTLGFSSRLQYKAWDLGFSMRASIGNYVFNDTEAGFANVAKTYDSSFGYTHNITTLAKQNMWCTYDNCLSDYYVKNASFLKCDNITLGYSFEDLFKNGNFKGLSGRVNLTASNVFTITKYEGIDPEVNGGIDNNLYPRPFSMMLGLSLNF